MAVISSQATADFVDAQGPSTAPLDAAAEYLRTHMGRVLPLYVLAMTPHAILSVFLIDAMVGEQRTIVPQYCLYLMAAMVWRWVWLARLQDRVEQDLHERRGTAFWARVAPILLLRLWGNFAITWGSLLAGVPAFYGLYVGSFATPLLLNNDDPVFSRFGQSLSWIAHAGKRLLRVLMSMTAIACLLMVAVFVSQALLVGTVLPSILGLDTAELNVTLDSWAWRLRVLYFIFLLLDLFWAVASVILFYDSQSRRMATDLRARLLRLNAEAA